MSNLQAKEYKNFEEIKRTKEDGTEYWYARELSDVLQYKKWENFAKVIDRAKLACQNSGFEIQDHFPEVRKTIEMPENATKDVLDYEPHYTVGKTVRKVIQDIGGTMPEDLPTPEKSIKQIKKEQLSRIKDKNTILMLDE